MANEVLNSLLVTNGGRMSAVMAAALHVNLYDATSLRALMEYRPQSAIGGSATTRVVGVTRGLNFAAASSEIVGGASNTALTTNYYDLTVARYLAQFNPSDLMNLTGDGGAGINVPLMVSLLLEGLDLTLTNMLAAALANLSTSVGTSGVNLSVSNFFSAKYALNLTYNGPGLAAILHPQQVNDLEESIRGEGGAMQYRQDAQMMLNAKSTGYIGTFLGVDIYQSGRVATANAGADRCGAMISKGAFAYTMGMVERILAARMLNPGDVIASSPEMFIELKRDADNAQSWLIANMYPSVAEQEDLRGVKIVTDA